MRGIEQVGGDVPYRRVGKAVFGELDGGLGDVESDGVEPEPSEVFGVGAQAASDDDRLPSHPG